MIAYCPSCKMPVSVSKEILQHNLSITCPKCNALFKSNSSLQPVSTPDKSAHSNIPKQNTFKSTGNTASQIANISIVFYVLAAITAIGGLISLDSVGSLGLISGIVTSIFIIGFGRILDLLWHINNNLKK